MGAQLGQPPPQHLGAVKDEVACSADQTYSQSPVDKVSQHRSDSNRLGVHRVSLWLKILIQVRAGVDGDASWRSIQALHEIPATVSAIADAIRFANEIMCEIDRLWPNR